MKALNNIRSCFLLLLLPTLFSTVTYGQDSKKDKEAKKAAEIANLVDSQNYVFKAQMVFPMGGRSRSLTTTDYDLRVSKESVVSYLPYFGRAYSATPGASGGIDFTSKDFEYTVTPTKKGAWDIVIKPKDTQVARELRLTVQKNGSANLQVNSNDKQSISYSGYLAAIPAKK